MIELTGLTADKKRTVRVSMNPALIEAITDHSGFDSLKNGNTGVRISGVLVEVMESYDEVKAMIKGVTGHPSQREPRTELPPARFEPGGA